MTKAMLLFAVFAFLLTACGDGTGPAAPPPTSFAVAGDSQTRFVGSMLERSLAVHLVDAEGLTTRTSGVPVSWTVVDGSGSLGRENDTTGVGGVSRTSWTLGPEEGTQRVEVTVGSFPPHTFTAEAVPHGPIAFVSNRRTGNVPDDIRDMAGDVFLMAADGSQALQLSPNFETLDWLHEPSWDPTGEHVAYVSVPTGAGEAGTIHSIRLDDEYEQIIGPPESGFSGPSWSPESRRLVVWRPNAAGLYLISPAWGLNYIRLRWQHYTVMTPDSRSPDWSPDGSLIAFACGSESGSDICTFKDDASDLVHLSGGPGDTDPAWSPDGSQILFARNPANAGGVWLMNADGSGETQVLQGHATSPSWSPDGTQFVVAIADGDRSDIWRVTIANGEAVNLTNGIGYNWDPDWRW